MCNNDLLHAANWLSRQPVQAPCNAGVEAYLRAAYNQWSALTTTGQMNAIDAATAVLQAAKETAA